MRGLPSNSRQCAAHLAPSSVFFALLSVSRGSAIAAAICLVFLFLAGCATPPEYPQRATVDCSAHTTREGISVGVYPVFSEDELDNYFGTDLIDRGIVPVLVVVENHAPQGSVLISGDSCSSSQTSGADPKESLTSPNTAVWASAAAGPVVGTALALDAGSKRTSLSLKALRSQTVFPGRSGQGFVYLTIPGKLPVKGTVWTVKVRLARAASDQVLDFELPVIWTRE